MTGAKLEALGDARFRLSGALNAETAGEVLKQSEQSFAQGQRVDIDLSGVAQSDSAGLALLIEWLRRARLAGQSVHFANVPAQISALARISEVEELIGLNDSASAAARP